MGGLAGSHGSTFLDAKEVKDVKAFLHDTRLYDSYVPLVPPSDRSPMVTYMASSQQSNSQQ